MSQTAPNKSYLHPLKNGGVPIFRKSKKLKFIIMSKVFIYLNFRGNTEDAFNFYKSVFKTEWETPVMYMKDIPAQPGMPPLSDSVDQLTAFSY